MDIKLGFDLNCFTNRYTEPEAWTDLVASCGVRVVQFNFDIIDFLLPQKIQDRLVDRTLDCCRAKKIRIKCAFGGHNHHQNYLGHPDDEVAAVYEGFYRRMADLTVALGAEGFGTCFAIMTVAVHKDRQQRNEILARAIDAYHRLADYSKKIGLKYLLYEITSVPRETCATFEENDYVLSKMKDSALPMNLCLDVGHRNRQIDGAAESCPYAWIEKYGRVTAMIHIQQCDQTGSHHWPFTPQYNAKGDIFPEKIIKAIEKSGAEQEILLALEVRHKASFPEEYNQEKDIKESVDYWRRWVEQ